MVGTLVDVGRGKIRPVTIPALFSGENGVTAGMTAPAHGLCLFEVYY
jgi:tRNA pseudouridine38-40 synthase